METRGKLATRKIGHTLRDPFPQRCCRRVLALNPLMGVSLGYRQGMWPVPNQ